MGLGGPGYGPSDWSGWGDWASADISSDGPPQREPKPPLPTWFVAVLVTVVIGGLVALIVGWVVWAHRPDQEAAVAPGYSHFGNTQGVCEWAEYSSDMGPQTHGWHSCEEPIVVTNPGRLFNVRYTLDGVTTDTWRRLRDGSGCHAMFANERGDDINKVSAQDNSYFGGGSVLWFSGTFSELGRMQLKVYCSGHLDARFWFELH